jgi:hypothetical protein
MEREPVRHSASPRILSALVGSWVCISAFVWPHPPIQAANTWFVGLLCGFFSLLATSQPRARWVTAVLAVWLFVSSWLLPNETIGTVWNNVLSAIAIFVLAFVPNETIDASCGRYGRSAPPTRI